MDIAQMEIQARCDRDEIRRLRKENARLTGELAEIRCELRKHDARDIPITSIEMIRNLTRERDEARAELAKREEAHLGTIGLREKAEAEVARLEGLILDWDEAPMTDHGPLTTLCVEARRIRAQREEGK